MKDLIEHLKKKYPQYVVQGVALPGHKFNPEYCSVFTDPLHQHMIITPGGEKLYGTIKTVVTDGNDQQPTCEVTLFCNLVSDEDEARYRYEINLDK
jgi:hypothetical protein